MTSSSPLPGALRKTSARGSTMAASGWPRRPARSSIARHGWPREEGRGLGEVVGREIIRARLTLPRRQHFCRRLSRRCSGDRTRALGADIIHMHPAADGAAIGKATMADFHRLVAVLATLARGVVLNLGSAVVMPEVFLKALNLARNLGRRVDDFCAADMDFIRQYRPRLNVVERPTAAAGADAESRSPAITRSCFHCSPRQCARNSRGPCGGEVDDGAAHVDRSGNPLRSRCSPTSATATIMPA